MDFTNILFIRMDEIGDMCYSMHVFKLIKERYPQAKLTLWCKPPAAGLAKNSPYLNYVFTKKEELKGKYDLIIDLRGLNQGLKYAISHPPKYRLERGKVRLQNKLKGSQPHELVTNYEIIKPILNAKVQLEIPKIDSLPADFKNANEFIALHKLEKYALIHATAKRELKQWSGEKFAQIAKFLKEKYALDIVFCGDKSDCEKIEKIQAQIPFPTYSIAGVLSLGAFAALATKASFFIGNDSSPLHIATLSGVPSLGLFGPGQSDTFYPYGKQSSFLHHILPCNPCDQIHCVHPDNPCIQRILVEEVMEKIDELFISTLRQAQCNAPLDER